MIDPNILIAGATIIGSGILAAGTATHKLNGTISKVDGIDGKLDQITADIAANHLQNTVRSENLDTRLVNVETEVDRLRDAG